MYNQDERLSLLAKYIRDCREHIATNGEHKCTKNCEGRPKTYRTLFCKNCHMPIEHRQTESSITSGWWHVLENFKSCPGIVNTFAQPKEE